jgi:PTS system nitrogen regulatory IIA component
MVLRLPKPWTGCRTRDSGVDHLKALALVSRTMRDTAICAKLRANDEAATLYAVLTEDRASQAA